MLKKSRIRSDLRAIILSLSPCLHPIHTLILVIILSLSFNSFSQTVMGNPVVGAVTDTSAKIVFITPETDGLLQVKEKDTIIFEADFKSFIWIKDTISGQMVIHIDNLKPSTLYTYMLTLSFSGSIFSGSFKTFPPANDTTSFLFTLGSCTEQHYNDSIFIEMKRQEPLFFLHLGDWLYTNNFNEEKYYYTKSLEHQKELYRKRYEMPNLKQLLQTTPIDFVFDDEDGVFDDFSRNTYTELKMNGNKTIIHEIPYPDSLRRMAVQGLHTFFPSYEQNENETYHSFVCGNTEIFFLDTRSTRSSNTASFLPDGDYYSYKVPDGHHMLDSMQLNWLLNGLKNSKAQWKFIVSGVTFNKSYKKVLDIAMLNRVQNRKLYDNMTGTYIAASLASMWFAFPETQAALLNFCHSNKIKNVIVLSGDAHTAAIDDGGNAGFPELMAGGLAQKNSKLASIIYNKMQMNLWNQGGQGIRNANFNDAFGRVEVNGNVSVRLSCVDKYGKTICSYEVKDGFIPGKYKAKKNRSVSFGDKIKAAKQALKIKKNLGN